MTFSVIVIPDTQEITHSHPELFAAMTRWIADQKERLDIRMVLHLGDVIENGEDVDAELRHAKAALDTIDEAGIPLLIAAGNHDYDNKLKRDRSLTMFNRYFGTERYAGKPWFGGAFEEGHAENVFAVMEIDGVKRLFLALEFGPRDETLAWADRVLTRYADHEAIIITHCYMYIHGERSKPGDEHHPSTYPGAFPANDGESMWHKCFKKHANIVAVYSGHQVPRNVSFRSDRGEAGNLVFQSFQNWQMTDRGGHGRIRVIRFEEAGARLRHRVYNPLLDRYEAEDGYEVSFEPKAAEDDRRAFAGITVVPSE